MPLQDSEYFCYECARLRKPGALCQKHACATWLKVACEIVAGDLEAGKMPPLGLQGSAKVLREAVADYNSVRATTPSVADYLPHGVPGVGKTVAKE